MWWLAIPVIIGAAALIIDELGNEADEERSRWESKREQVEQDLEWHRNNIERHLKDAQRTHDFHQLVNLHYSSVKVADEAYKLLSDARISLNAIGKALLSARIERDRLKDERKAISSQSEKQEKTKEIESLISLRKQLFTQKEEIEGQKDYFYSQVKLLNIQTMELKNLIKDTTGHKGADWFARLEQRKRERV